MQLVERSISEVSFSSAQSLSRPGLTERVATLLLLFILGFGVPTTWFRAFGEFGAVSDSDPVTQFSFVALFGFCLSRMLGNEGVMVRALQRAPWVVAFVLLAALSVFWTSDISLTLVNSIALLLTTAFAAYLFARYELREIMLMIGIACAVGALANLIWVLGFPQYSETNLGWSGVLTDKNTFGRLTVFGVTQILLAYGVDRRHRLLWFGSAGILVFLLIGSASATSLVSGICLAVAVLVFRLFRAKKTLFGVVIISYIVGVASIALVLFVEIDFITGLFGKEATLTGRTELWALLPPYIMERPFLGYGYTGFWTGWFGPNHDVWIDFGTDLPHAHNGALQVALDLGVIGLFLLLMAYVRGVTYATRFIQSTPGATGLWPLTTFTACLLLSVSEAGVQGRNLLWVAFVVASLTVSGHTRDARDKKIARRRERAAELAAQR